MNLLEKFNIIPNDEHLYEVAFMHGSYSAKIGVDYTYERLEFLGDSVLLTWGNSDIHALMENYGYYFGDDRPPYLTKYCDLQIYCEFALGKIMIFADCLITIFSFS